MKLKGQGMPMKLRIRRSSLVLAPMAILGIGMLGGCTLGATNADLTMFLGDLMRQLLTAALL